MEKTITLVPGAEISIKTTKDGTVITMYEPEKEPVFKDGDIITMYCKHGSIIAILQNGLINDYSSEAYAHLGTSGILFIGERFGFYPSKGDEINYSTEEQKHKLFDALAKDGKQWNAEKKCIEELRWKPVLGSHYHFLTESLSVIKTTWDNDVTDNMRYDAYNCFQTKEEADQTIPYIIEALKNRNKK